MLVLRLTLPFAQFLFATEIQNGYKFRGCYITSANFRPDGIAMLEDLKKGSLKPALLDCFYNGQKLLGLVKELDLEKADKILNAATRRRRSWKRTLCFNNSTWRWVIPFKHFPGCDLF